MEEISLLLEKKLGEKLDPLVTSLNLVCDQISAIDQRLSLLEGSTGKELPTVTFSDPKNPRPTPQVNFDNKDDMMKRAYDTLSEFPMLRRAYNVLLAEAPRPLTTQEVADKIGRSRSTTSQYLNELQKMKLLDKEHGETPDQSRNIVFRLSYRNQVEI